MHHHTTARPDLDDEGPSPSDLAAIEAEWPLIAAEIDLVDAEIRMASAGPFGPTELDWRHLRRKQHAVLRIAAQLTATRRVQMDATPTRRAA